MAASSSSTRRAEKRPRSDSSSQPAFRAPWPRQAGALFTLPADWARKSSTQILSGSAYAAHLDQDEWTDFDSYYYNGLAGVEVLPTRILFKKTLVKLGIRHQMEQVIRSLGLGTIASKYYPLYPDLVRQFIASCQVEYASMDQTARHGRLKFKINGMCYRLSFEEICSCFGFDATKERTTLPTAFPEAQIIWGEIARGRYAARTATQKDIRHPVLRLLAKTIGHTLFCAMENSQMRLRTLYLLSFAVGDRWGAEHGFRDYHTFNMGALFAHHLIEQKEKALSPSGKVERIGSLITPLLRKAGVVIPPGSEKVTDEAYIDEDHLKGNFLKKCDGGGRITDWCVEYLSAEGEKLYVELPSRYTAIETLEDLRFQVPADEHYTFLPRSRRSSRATPVRTFSTEHASSSAEDPAELGPYPFASDEVLADSVRFRRHQDTVMSRIWNFLRCTRVRADDVAPSTSARRPSTPSEEDSETE